MEEFTQCIKSDAKEIERTESFIRARGSSPLEGLFLIESTVAARHFPSHDRRKVTTEMALLIVRRAAQ